jgi:hypothetical protein
MMSRSSAPAIAATVVSQSSAALRSDPRDQYQPSDRAFLTGCPLCGGAVR